MAPLRSSGENTTQIFMTAMVAELEALEERQAEVAGDQDAGEIPDEVATIFLEVLAERHGMVEELLGYYRSHSGGVSGWVTR